MSTKKVIRLNLSGKRFDQPERGWLVQLMPTLTEVLGSIEDIHAVSLEPGVVRGNHFHRDRIEALLPLSEGLTIAWIDEDGRTEEKSVGAAQILYIFPPDVPHAIRNDGIATAVAIAFGNAAYRPEQPDRYFFDLL